MEDTIRVALARWRDRQPNMGSESFRNNLAEEIALLLREKGTYTKFTKDELSEKLDREIWVCDICGESTYDVEYDYIGSGTNHLSCEIRLELDENYRKKNWSQKKHEEKVFDEYAEDIDEQAFAQGRGSSLYEDPGDGSLQLVTDEEKEQMWVDKLVEEVIDDNDTNYIYESPDSGKTVYRRKIGSSERELVKDWKTISGQSKVK